MAVTKDILEAWAKSRGWTQDRWGHWHRANYRLKLSRIAARYELRSGTGWIRLRSAYYHSIDITAEGKLKGLLRDVCAPLPAAPATAQINNQPGAAEPLTQGTFLMKKTFAITPENEVIVYANLKAARATSPNAAYFTDIDGLAVVTAEWLGSRLIDLYNSIPGNSEVKKFTDRKTALRRIWNAIQNLSAPEVAATPEAICCPACAFSLWSTRMSPSAVAQLIGWVRPCMVCFSCIAQPAPIATIPRP